MSDSEIVNAEYENVFNWTLTTIGDTTVANNPNLHKIKTKTINYLSMDYEKKRDLIIDLIKNYKKLCDNIVTPHYIFISIAIIAIILFIIKFSFFISSVIK